MYVIDSLGASGAEHSIAAMMPMLQERGHEVSAATLYDSKFGDEERLRSSGLDVQPLRARWPVHRVRELRRRIRAEAPDVVHTTLFRADMVGRLAAWGTGVPVVSSLVNTPYDPARRTDPNVKAWKLMLVRLLDAGTGRLMVDRFHAVSEGVADVSARDLRLPRKRIQVVQRGRSRDHLGVWSEQRRFQTRASLGVAQDAPLVVAAGRQEHQKAHVHLVEAAAELASVVPGLVVLIAGREGNASPALQRVLRETRGASEVVRLLGHRHDVPDLLCAADVLAIPSLFEGTAGVALEAMALRCPVVCTDLEGVKGVLRDRDNACLVPVGDPHAMADVLQQVLTERELADGLRASGLADFERTYTIEVAAKAMEAFYIDVVESGRRRGGKGRHSG